MNQQLRQRIRDLENNEAFAQMSEELEDAKHECLALSSYNNNTQQRVDILERSVLCAQYFLRYEVALRRRMQKCFTTWVMVSRPAASRQDARLQDRRSADPHTGPPNTNINSEPRVAAGPVVNRHAAGAISITRWRHNHTLKSVSVSVAWHKWRSHFHRHWAHGEVRRLRGEGDAASLQRSAQPESIAFEEEGGAWRELEEAVAGLGDLCQKAK